MKIEYEKSNSAFHSIISDPSQTITIDANILIPPDRGTIMFPIHNYNRNWIQPLFLAFPNIAIHEAVFEEVIGQALKDIVNNAINSNPPKLCLHRDCELSLNEMAIRNTIESRIAPFTCYNPALDNKDDRGEVKSLAYIVAKGLIYFAGRDSKAIQLINEAEKLKTSLDSLSSLQPYELIFYLYKRGYSGKEDMRYLYKYLYYLTQRDKKENLGWAEYVGKMECNYPDL